MLTQKLKKSVNDIYPVIIFFLIWRICLFLVGYFGNFNFPNFPQTLFYQDIHPIFSMWMPFDAGWYVRIAQEGYGFSTQAPAFFPLFPIIIAISKKILFFFDIRIVAFLVANIFSLGSCIFLYKLVNDQFGDKDLAYRTVKYLLLFPMSIFLATSYTEPIFLFFVISSFYFFKRGNFVLAILLASLSALTRSVGIIMFFPIIFELVKNILKTRKVLFKGLIGCVSTLLIPLSTIMYMFYLKLSQGDFFAFFHAQVSGGWDKSIGSGAIVELYENTITLLQMNFFNQDASYIFAFMRSGLLLIFLAIILFNIKKIPAKYIIYSFLVLLFPLVGGNLLSMNRFVLIAFPVFIILAINSKNKYVDEVISISMTMLLAMFTVMFVNGYWVG